MFPCPAPSGSPRLAPLNISCSRIDLMDLSSPTTAPADGAQPPPTDDGDDGDAERVPGEEVVANVLHVLSTRTETSPLLLCRCAREGGDARAVSWDPPSLWGFESGVGSSGRSGDFLWDWLSGVADKSMPQGRGGGGTDTQDRARRAFASTGEVDELPSGDGKPDDVALWRAGLEVLKGQLYPDGCRGSSSASNNSEGIAPHELLTTVIDSYYCSDRDLDLGHLVAFTGAEIACSSEERMFRLPTSVAMLIVRTLLASHALEKAEGSIPKQGDEPSSSKPPVRWRRLKSMVDDATCLFRKMVFDYTGRAIDDCERTMEDLEPQELRPVEPGHVAAVASWSYARHLFPSCRALLRRLLDNETSGSGKGPSGVKLLESCYGLFETLTILLALGSTAVDQDYTVPSRPAQWVLKAIEDGGTDQFFDLVISTQKIVAREEDDDLSDDDEEEMMYRPWNDAGPDLNRRGSSLEEDLLLFPSNRRASGALDECSDEMGIAFLAYWKLQALVNPGTHPYLVQPM